MEAIWDSICDSCDREYTYSRAKGHTKSHCNTCIQRRRRRKIQDQILEYKGGGCQICRYDRCKRALSYHHLDPSQKDFTIGSAECRSWDSIRAELDKCILVCNNCHMEIHEGLHPEAGAVAQLVERDSHTV